MAFFKYGYHEIHYEFNGPSGRPVVTIINGLIQGTQHWNRHIKIFTDAGYRVLTFDLLGQGTSSKPILFVDFDENHKILAALFDHLQIKKAYVMGISFGGAIALKLAINYPQKIKGLIPMSTFSEMDEQLILKGLNLYMGMTKIGFEYLVDFFNAFNFSSSWMLKNKEVLEISKRKSFSCNDLYAIQNLIESIRNFHGFTPELKKIKCPTLIMNAEYDFLTPRWCHEVMRKNIKNSRLMLMQHVCHAFTVEIPEITCRIVIDFMEQVENKKWKGDQSVWIATDDPNASVLASPCEGDHTRGIPLFFRKRGKVNADKQ
jgi:pimeloyl-ACP methyl ester carboxylesterase